MDMLINLKKMKLETVSRIEKNKKYYLRMNINFMS